MTPEQKALARHALGLPNGRRRSYRNYFVAGGLHPDYADWMQMVERGEAERRRSMMKDDESLFFRLTRAGADQALEPGERLDPEDFPR